MRALIRVAAAPAGGYAAQGRCSRHRVSTATGATAEAAVAAVRQQHAAACACGWMDAAPVAELSAAGEVKRASPGCRPAGDLPPAGAAVSGRTE